MVSSTSVSATPKFLKPTTHFDAMLGQVLAWLREQQGWAQGEMARRVGVSHPVWSRIERGEAGLSSNRLRVAAGVLGTTPAQIHALAAQATTGVEDQGVAVVDQRPSDWVVAGAIVVGIAAVAALVAALLADD